MARRRSTALAKRRAPRRHLRGAGRGTPLWAKVLIGYAAAGAAVVTYDQVNRSRINPVLDFALWPVSLALRHLKFSY